MRYFECGLNRFDLIAVKRRKEREREREMASIFIRDTLHGLQTRFAFRRIIDTMDACNDFGSNERIVSIVIESKMGKTWPGSGYNFNPRFYVALLLHNLYFYYFQYPSNFSNFVKIRPIPHSKSRGARFSSFPSIQLPRASPSSSSSACRRNILESPRLGNEANYWHGRRSNQFQFSGCLIRPIYNQPVPDISSLAR